jgi:hypothetical protein
MKVKTEITSNLTSSLQSEEGWRFLQQTRSTAIAVKPRSRANSVKERTRGLKRRLEADQQEEVKNKFVTNVPKLLLEVSLSQFRFFACYLK